MSQYPNGETITVDRMEDESWYPDFQAVCEVICVGPDPNQRAFYERLPDGKEKALLACKQYFENFPGPIDQGWEPPSDERLKRWIDSCWIPESVIQKIEAIGS